MNNPPASLTSLDWSSPHAQSDSPRHVPNHQALKHAGDKSVTMDAKKPLTITELASESVSRILSLRRHGPDLRRNFRRRGAMIIPLGPGSLRDSSSLPEGRSNLLLRARCIRAGPALPSYLALLHAGFSVPRMLPSERWALTPPFHPCQMRCAETGRAVVSRRPAAEAIASPAV
jgi:hypothetical protein